MPTLPQVPQRRRYCRRLFLPSPLPAPCCVLMCPWCTGKAFGNRYCADQIETPTAGWVVDVLRVLMAPPLTMADSMCFY